MNNMPLSRELVESIQAERMNEAARRRVLSRQMIRASRSPQDPMRMALGPGLQFGGVSEQLIDTVTGRRLCMTC